MLGPRHYFGDLWLVWMVVITLNGWAYMWTHEARWPAYPAVVAAVIATFGSLMAVQWWRRG